jgi:hypothetical protein
MRFFFPNGYGASIIVPFDRHYDPEKPYELAVLQGTEEFYDLTYATPITHDVINNLSDEEVAKYLQQIEALPCPDPTLPWPKVPPTPSSTS